VVLARQEELGAEREVWKVAAQKGRHELEALKEAVAMLQREARERQAELDTTRHQLGAERTAQEAARQWLAEAGLSGSGSGRDPTFAAEAGAQARRDRLLPGVGAGAMGATTEQGEAARRAAAERMCTAVTLELGVMRRELLDARREAEAQRKEVAVGLVKARELEAEVGVREEAARASRKSEDWLRVRNAELQAALDEAQRERARLQVEAAERPLRLVPHTPYTPGVERKKMVAGAFSTPVIDAMVQASMERSGMRSE
jgi:hypothetical protein